MKPVAAIAVGVVAVAAAAAIGYGLGQSRSPAPAPSVAVTGVAEPTKKAPKLLYYRNPMGLPDIRVAGRVEPDERRIFAIAPRFEGYVERLHVNVTGQPVAKGQPLFEFYSPELVSLQREYAIAAQGVLSLKGADSPAWGVWWNRACNG